METSQGVVIMATAGGGAITIRISRVPRVPFVPNYPQKKLTDKNPALDVHMLNFPPPIENSTPFGILQVSLLKGLSIDKMGLML